MRIIADTNVLVRAVTADEPNQTAIAQAELRNADVVAIGVACLCEVAWVLSRIYKISTRDIASAIRGLVNGANVSVHWQAVEAGLAMLDAGGDFADGVFAFEGLRLGGETVVSFDRQAVRLLNARDVDARQL